MKQKFMQMKDIILINSTFKNYILEVQKKMQQELLQKKSLDIDTDKLMIHLKFSNKEIKK